MSFFEHSSPNPRKLPKHLLTEEELQFVSWLTPNPSGYNQPLFTALQIAEKLLELWGDFLGQIDGYSLSKHLLSKTKHYAERDYHSNTQPVRKLSLRLFSKGLLRKYPMPAYRAKLQYWYGYPREWYQLKTSNFTARFPPHDSFAAWCFREITNGVGNGVLKEASSEMLKIPHWDGSGEYVCDGCYKVELDGRKEYWWFEIHTGSEGYDEKIFLKRLRSAYDYTKYRGKYVAILPFPRDLTSAKSALLKYTTNNNIELRNILLYHYKQITYLKQQMGFYKHKKRL